MLRTAGGNHVPVSLGPVGGGLVTGLSDLARLAGSQMFAVDHLREIGFRATEGGDQEERRRRSTTSWSGCSTPGTAGSNSWRQDQVDAGFWGSEGPLLREHLRKEEKVKWERSDRRVKWMDGMACKEVKT